MSDYYTTRAASLNLNTMPTNELEKVSRALYEEVEAERQVARSLEQVKADAEWAIRNLQTLIQRVDEYQAGTSTYCPVSSDNPLSLIQRIQENLLEGKVHSTYFAQARRRTDKLVSGE